MGQIGKVLRIKKIPKDKMQPENGCLVLSNDEQLLWKDFRELVESTSTELAGQVYMKQVMGPLLDPKHIDEGVCISSFSLSS